jgi:hypothetical protein
MKTLIFSSKVALDGLPSGFSGVFKMLHMETGQLYVYRVHIAKHIYVGSHIQGMGSSAEDEKWRQCMFYALIAFIKKYNAVYGHLPSDRNIYQDRRPYTSDEQPIGEKVYFLVEESKCRSLHERELTLED